MSDSKTKKKILIIDDEVDVAEQLAINLDGSGYEVETVSKPAEALETTIRFRPDAVLLDYVMPKISGADVYKKLRRINGFAQTPIIFVSAVAPASPEGSDPTAAGGGPLQKPVELKDLVKRIEAELDAVSHD